MMQQTMDSTMQTPVTRSEVLDIATYEKVRPGFREEVLAIKTKRRVQVGRYFNFIFENHMTVLYQIQEMIRVERIMEEAAIEHELTTYNALIPPPGGLSSTLLMEYADRELRARELPKLMGIENHVWLNVGGMPPLAARFDMAQIGEARVSSVQYLTFELTDTHREAWVGAAATGALKLVVDHAHYTAEAVISPEVAGALAQDFS
jgi:hypothetical protein